MKTSTSLAHANAQQALTPLESPAKHAFPVGYADHYELALPEGHRFPVQKYRLLKEQLLHRGIVEPAQLYAPTLLPRAVLRLAHTEGYLTDLEKGTLPPRAARKIGLPVNERLVMRAWASASITFWSALRALETGIGANLGGGTHHAYADRGEGFCVFNDIAISALYLLGAGYIRRALVIDLDVHQGNGTAALLAATPAVFTLSVHGESNYPLRKERSSFDLGLPTGTNDAAYLAAVTPLIPKLIDTHRPDLVYYIAGSDVLAGDRLGHLALSPEGMAQRDRLVLSQCHRLGIPLVLTMGGGYHRSLAKSIDAHTETYAIATDLYC